MTRWVCLSCVMKLVLSRKCCGLVYNITRYQPSVTRWIGSLQLLELGSMMADGETIDPSTIYYIYGEETENAIWEENIYEEIDATDDLPHVYDEILQNPTDSKNLEEDVKIDNSVKKTHTLAWLTCTPLRKISISFIIFLVTMGYLSMDGRITILAAKSESTTNFFKN
ncbi:hypothetical protein J6590_080214 [Homalodisca vitripennis]|nr:hypothetical protein J6590_080214 [Homalodisca vitripennis]